MDYIPYQEIVSQLPIEKGDVLLVTSDVQKLAVVAMKNRERFSPAAFIESLTEAVGPEGTLLFPTYNWSFCRGETFDYHRTPCMTGALGREALKMPGFRRSAHPIYSFAIWGKDRDLLCAMNNKSAFGEDSPFAYLCEKGKNLIIDVSLQHSFTFAHYVEEQVGVVYRYQKTFTAPYIDADGQEEEHSYSMLVRDLDRDVETLLDPIGEDMEALGLLEKKEINGSSFSVLRFADFYELARRDILDNKARKLTCYKGQEEDESGSMYRLAERLFPICRSLTGDGVRETLRILQEIVPEMTLHEVPSGSQVFDWTVPQEWNIRNAYIEDMDGERVISFGDNNLHVMGYSLPVDKIVRREELLAMVYTQPEQPDLIPYVTSYYSPRSGFCMSENQKASLDQEQYHIVIDSELKDGSLSYGEILLPGESEREIFFSTYVCHPSMANNELSGPCVAIHLAKWLKEHPHKYSYRFVFIPETIGSITYLSRHLGKMQKNMLAGFNVSCVGDDRAFSYVPSRYGDTLADKAALNVLSFYAPDYIAYSYLDRGSDERQYCAPGVDLPVCSICRSKYGEYPEYHTSGDKLDLISPAGLGRAFQAYLYCIQGLEANGYYQCSCLCEPQLGKRGLYPTISRKGQYDQVKVMMDFIAYADGRNDLFDISNRIGVPVWELLPVAEKLTAEGLFKVKEQEGMDRP